uniref:NADH-ubiquinone oxidoreductase chain 3 n=1 Tax=Dirofilaria repens TaxID=31241 RepID=A0A141CQS9_9BILA|nr:NADH dehydrogenase subunit 3 [Dirofilaria repens]AKU47227.1 NADH dehydrogenase subunit 3 [Dirofilaria repens]AOP18652.1 NADH dehydrogenase subunit 3 [Dirofilaria repens]
MFLSFVFVFFFSFFVPFFMYLLSFFFSFKDFFVGKLSSYECGFDVCKKVHVGFNLVFFSIVLLFVVFELEVVIFIFLVYGDYYSMFSFFLFFSYVVFSFYMEWFFGKLVWIC